MTDGYIPMESLGGFYRKEVALPAALVDEFKGMWPTIDGDLRDGSRNGLSAKANANHGYWKVGPALNWALERRRLEKPKAEEFIRAEGQSELSILVRAMLDRK
jgi:hypothetical protein